MSAGGELRRSLPGTGGKPLTGHLLTTTHSHLTGTGPMRICLLLLLLTAGTSGCVRLAGPGALMHRFSQQRKLSAAVSLLEQGKPEAAVPVLTSVGSDPGVPGVSDEALLRLGLLHLGDEQTQGSSAQARQDLERLVREYPASSWAQMSANLSKALVTFDDTLQQYRKYEVMNDSLKGENRELKNTCNALAQKNRELKELERTLFQENLKFKEHVNSLAKENIELHRDIEQLKALDLDLERKNKH